jgi:outer membrane protein
MFRLSSISALAMCAAALVFSPDASAQSALPPAGSGQTKIAVIDLRKAILETAEIKKASNDLQNKYKPRQDVLEKAQRDLSDLEAQMQASQGRLSPQGEADLTARGKRKQTEVTRLTQDLQDDVNHERDAIIQSAGQRMTEIIKKILDQRGLDAVLDTTQLVAFRPSLEITTECIAAFDKAYPLKPGK